MIPAAAPENEDLRLEALRSYRVLDTAAESAYDDITYIASLICGAPISAVSLIDESRQWFKSRIGLNDPETSREIAFCAHAIRGQGVFTVANTLEDERFRDNPLVTGDPELRFYAGAPLVTPAGYAVGTLCVMDRRPRELTPEPTSALQRLAAQVVALLELRKRVDELADTRRDLEESLDLQKAVLNSADFSIISTDVDGTIRGFNAGAARLLGYTAAEVIGRETPGMLHDPGEIAERARQLTAELGCPVEPGFEAFVAKSAQGMPDEREWTYIRKDKTRFPVRLSVTPIRARSGQIRGYLGIAKDITTEREMRAQRDALFEKLNRANALLSTELQSTQEQYKLLVEGSSEIVFSARVTGEITSINHRVGILGYSPAQVVGQRIWDMPANPEVKGVMQELVRERFEALLSSRLRQEFAARLASASGEPVDLLISLELVDLGEPVVFGRASLFAEDLLGRYCQTERARYAVGNSLSMIDLVSRRCTAAAAYHLTEDELEGVRLGMREALMNAIEHGNLEISFEQKTDATEAGRLLELLRMRLQDPVLSARRVTVDYDFDGNRVEYVITDEGPGFDFKSMENRNIRSKQEIFRKHGRGIALARAMFDEVKYEGRGNRVRLTKRLQSDAPRADL
jgi:PAS domain S-box-containing protein